MTGDDRVLTFIQILAMRIQYPKNWNETGLLTSVQYFVSFIQHLLGHGRRKKTEIDPQV